MKDKANQRDATIAANITVHSALANSGEYNKSPHFLPENQRKVRKILEGLSSELGQTTSMLDIGCGTGFIIALAHDLFDLVHGLDITEDMMKQIDLSSGNIELFTGQAEAMPFPSGAYDFVSAYSFLDHVIDYRDVLSEVYRVLRPGGVFYADLNPNRFFAQALQNIERRGDQHLPPIVEREVRGMLHNGDYYEEKFGIDESTLTSAEPIKSFDRGFDPFEFVQTAKDLGFTEANFDYDWYLGQGTMMHQRPAGESEIVESFLRLGLPMTEHLFKYVRFTLKK